jgi:hypothetical protein
MGTERRRISKLDAGLDVTVRDAAAVGLDERARRHQAEAIPIGFCIAVRPAWLEEVRARAHLRAHARPVSVTAIRI